GHGEHGFNFFVAGLSTIVVIAGIALGYIIYCRELKKDPLADNALYKLAHHKFYFDEFYDNFIVAKIYNGIAKVCNFSEVNLIIHFFVNGFAYLTRELGKVLRLTTSGQLQHYTLVMVAGVVVLVLLFGVL
ncbi:MAG: NADH-quinone oxidoreductase subunit L, partial [Deltaproteobacteria bacterium]|nr:NADH-quinone oxidoreductase subunit L [Deltaproteobacteria bacterium]